MTSNKGTERKLRSATIAHFATLPHLPPAILEDSGQQEGGVLYSNIRRTAPYNCWSDARIFVTSFKLENASSCKSPLETPNIRSLGVAPDLLSVTFCAYSHHTHVLALAAVTQSTGTALFSLVFSSPGCFCACNTDQLSSRVDAAQP